MSKKKLIIISGPSCVGKGPLMQAMYEFYKKTGIIDYKILNMIKTPRPSGPRPGEKIEDFMTKEKMLELSENRQYILGDCRGNPQLFDINKVRESKTKLAILEVYHTIGKQIINSKYLSDIEVSTIFISPVSKKELNKTDNKSYLTGLMMSKLDYRTTIQGKNCTDKIIQEENISRAMDAYSELQSAKKYKHVIINRAGEGHPNWHMDEENKPYRTYKGRLIKPEYDALNTLEALIEISLFGHSNRSCVENWKGFTL